MSQEKSTRHEHVFSSERLTQLLTSNAHTQLTLHHSASPSQHPAKPRGSPGGFPPSTHVAFPQIFLWYHCLQLVKYFLLVPISFCTAQTLGLQEGQSRAGSVRGPTATRRASREGVQGVGCVGEVTKRREKGKSSPFTLQCYVFLHRVQKLHIFYLSPEYTGMMVWSRFLRQTAI